MAEGGGKRRQTEQLIKDRVDDGDADGPANDPGTWVADPDAIKARRKVHVKRGAHADGQMATDAPAAAAPGNPFAGVVLAPPAAANPFAGILLAPTAKPAEEPQNGDAATHAEGEQPATTAATAGQAAGEAAAEAAAEAATAAAPATVAPAAPTAPVTAAEPAAETAAPAADPGGAGGGFASLGAGTGNPFTSLRNKPFGGFGSSGGGFGALAASGTSFGSFGGTGGASASGSAAGLAAFAPSTFSFGTSTFPAVAAAPLSAGGGSAAATGAATGEGGDEEEGGEEEGGQGVALFDGAPGQPIVNLPVQAKVTGEEQDQIVFSAEGVLFEFDSTSNNWHERCKGIFKVNVKNEDGRQQARMVMRQAANLRLVLNAKVYEGMPLSVMPGKAGVTFGVFNAAAGPHTSEGGGAPEAAKPVDEAQAGQADAASEGGSAAAQGQASSGVKSTTIAIRIKSSEKVEKLHDLLLELKNPAVAGQPVDSAV